MRNLIPHYIQEEYQKEHFEGEFEGLTMLVDVSGFTLMTQALVTHGRTGAEVSATVINEIFDELTNAVYERGGFVSTFAGDISTAIFPFNDEIIPVKETVLQVFACVKRIQALFRGHGIQTTPFGQFIFHFRIGISGGKINWGIVGETERSYFFRGEAIDGCVASKHQAGEDEVIFDKYVTQRLKHVPGVTGRARYLRSIQVDYLSDGFCRIKKQPGGFYEGETRVEPLLEEFSLPDLPTSPELDPTVLSHFFPETVIHFPQIGEFRRVVSIFISFGGISTVNEINDWACVLLKNINTFGGYFHRLNFGGNDGCVLCGFGAPMAYENAIERAVNFIISVKEDLKSFQNLSDLRFRVGMTYGMAYAGIVGPEKRCEYTYYGAVVHLAACFMMKAGWGKIIVSKEIVQKAPKFNFVYQGDFSDKGITESVPTYTLVGRKIDGGQQRFTEAMIGRREELQRLQQFAAPIFRQSFAGLLGIYGEAGIGKSRLTYALQEVLVQQKGSIWFMCPTDQILHKPFHPFITCFMRYFKQSPENSEEENTATFEREYDELIEALSPHPRPLSQRERGEKPHSGLLPEGEGLGVRASEVRADILKELIRAKSIVGAQLGLFWKDSLWEQLNAKGKYENTVSAIKTFFLAHSLRQPVVIELEDGQWLDSDSLGVVQAFTHNITSYPLLILSTLRYAEDGSKPSLLNSQDVTERKIPYEEIELHEFSETDLRNFAEVSLGAPIDEPFYSVLAEKTDGNPLFGEQLLHYFRENECVERKDGTWQLKSADIHIPDTINVILMARIDRLPGEVKEMVKTAAVIGREFNVLLLSEMLQRDVFSEVKFVQKSRIWQELQNMSFMFTHVLLRDIAYEMQLTSRRRELHQRAAEVMEKLYASHLTEWYAALAFHYEKAEITNKTIEYLEKAADEAKAQYHNRQALEFYDRLLFYLQDMFGFSDLELETLLKKAEILELTGEWNECQRVCQQAFEFAEELDDICRMGKTNLLLGRISRQTGQYDRAIELFEQAKTRFEDVEDNEGVSRVLTNMGHVNRVKSDSGMALMYYEKALKMSEELGDTFGKARNANNIGIVYTELTINYEMAMMWYNKSLPLYKRIGEKQGEGVVLNNIGECHRLQGQYDLAMTCYGQALAIYEELGAKLDIAITLGNMGHVYQAKSDYERAIVHYDKAITLLKELGDKYFLSEYTLGKAEALFSLQHYEEAQTLNAEIQPITEEFGMKEDLLKSKVLAVKLDRVLGNTEALHGLYEMLQQTQDETELALLHYELWKMTQHNDHRRQALTLYQTLYENTPNIVYKKRKEELQDLSMSNEE